MDIIDYKTKCYRKLGGGRFHTNPLLDIAYRRRGIYGNSRVSYLFSDLLPYDGLLNIKKAANIISDHIIAGKKILILADYDCDGASACAVMYRSIKMMGSNNVEFSVPDRFTMGYGTTPALIDSIAHKKPDLIITVDNGISSFEGISHIRKVLPNTKVIVTDHHIANKNGLLPDADVIVNPNQIGCNFESKALCGCGVAWYVAMATNDVLENRSHFKFRNIKKPNLHMLVDIVALATVADVVDMNDYNNRLIVSYGLRLIRTGHGNLGIKSLFNEMRKYFNQAKSSDLAFNLGPSINSAGRLDNMDFGIILLTSDKTGVCGDAAKILVRMNNTRKEIQSGMVKDALKKVKELDNKLSIVVYDENYNEGVIGLVASKLRESYGVPTFVFTSSENGLLKGSGRSIDSIHLYNVLSEINDNSDFIIGFGGHAMAAGLSIKADCIDEFYQMFDDIVSKHISKPDEIIYNDGVIPAEYLNYDNISELKMVPWGQNFNEPAFESVLTLKSTRWFGKKNNHIQYLLSDENGREIVAVGFNPAERLHLFDEIFSTDESKENKKVKVFYRVEVDEFKGTKSFKLILESLKAFD